MTTAIQVRAPRSVRSDNIYSAMIGTILRPLGQRPASSVGADVRSTLHFWMRSSAYLIRLFCCGGETKYVSYVKQDIGRKNCSDVLKRWPANVCWCHYAFCCTTITSFQQWHAARTRKSRTFGPEHRNSSVTNLYHPTSLLYILTLFFKFIVDSRSNNSGTPVCYSCTKLTHSPKLACSPSDVGMEATLFRTRSNNVYSLDSTA